jgi:hypothetical protein
LNTNRNIDVVESNGVVGDDFEVGILVQELSVDGVRELGQEAVAPLHSLEELCRIQQHKMNTDGTSYIMAR